MSTTTRIFIVAALLSGIGCTVKDTPAPPLAGPSELALRVALQIVPDSILQDGASQAVLAIEASQPDGRPVRGLALRIDVIVDGVVQDYGTLSAKTAVTGEDGRTRVIYTAPPRPAAEDDQSTTVTFRVIPVGNDFAGEVSRTVALRLVTPGVILPPNSAPIPDFSSSGTLQPFNDIVFDASLTTDDGAACGASCTYRWEFGDGETGSGIFVRHQYKTSGTFQLKLTATDARGASGTMARPMQIGPATPPTAVFTFSPTPVETGQVVFFNAEQSTAAAGRRIVSYDWDFGSGRTATGVTTTKSFDNPGTYTVTLVVVDDAGAKGTTSRTVQVGNVTTNPGISLVASLTVTPATSAAAAASLATPLLFDASGSTGPSRIVEYRFNFGDGSPEVVQTTIPTWSYTYRAGGIYNARVTVRDAQGRSDTATVTVYVQ